MNARWLILGLALTLAPASLVGCGDSDDTSGSPQGGGGGTPNGGTQLAAGSYRGVFTGDSDMGSIEVVVPADSHAASLHLLHDGTTTPLTGTITPAGGEPVQLTGTYDPATGALSLSGGGYTLTGTVSSGGFSGSYTGPNGSGSFQATSDADGSTKVYCGGIAGTATGALTLLVKGATATGYVLPDGKNPAHLSCTITGSDIECGVTEHPTVEVSGSSNDSGWSGTWKNNGNDDNGTWTATSCD